MVIVSQIIALILQIFMAFTEKKRNVYIYNCLCDVFLMLSYYFKQDFTAFYLSIFVTIRAFIYIYSPKIKKYKWHWIVPLFTILIQLSIGIFTFQEPTQIIAIFAACFSCYYFWFFKTTQTIRIGNIINNGSWLIYNLLGGLWILCLMRLWTVSLNLIAYLKYKKQYKTNPPK